MVPRRSLSLARMAVFMSSVMRSLRLMGNSWGMKKPARAEPGGLCALGPQAQNIFLGNCMLRTRL